MSNNIDDAVPNIDNIYDELKDLQTRGENIVEKMQSYLNSRHMDREPNFEKLQKILDILCNFFPDQLDSIEHELIEICGLDQTDDDDSRSDDDNGDDDDD